LYAPNRFQDVKIEPKGKNVLKPRDFCFLPRIPESMSKSHVSDAWFNVYATCNWSNSSRLCIFCSLYFEVIIINYIFWSVPYWKYNPFLKSFVSFYGFDAMFVVRIRAQEHRRHVVRVIPFEHHIQVLTFFLSPSPSCVVFEIQYIYNPLLPYILFSYRIFQRFVKIFVIVGVSY